MSYLNDINMMTRGADFWRNTIGNDLRAKAAADAAPSPAPVAQPQSNPMPELKIVNKPNTFRTMESLKPKTNMFTQFFPEASAPIAGTQVSNVKAEVNGKPLVNETVKTVSFEPVGPMEGNAFKTSVSYGSPDYEKLNGQTNWKMPWPKLVDEEEEQADYFSSLQKNRKNAGMNLPANPVAEVKAVAPVEVKPASAPVVESVEVKPAVPEVKPAESAFPEEHPTFTALKGTDYNNMFKAAPVEAPKPQVNPQPTAPSYGDIATDAYNKAMSNYALDEKNMEAQRGLVNQATNHDANIFRRQEEAYNTLKQQYEDAAKSQKEDGGGILDWVNPLGIVQGVTDPLFARKVYNPSTRSYESKGPSSLKDAVGNLVRNVATAGSGLQVSRRGKNWSFGYDPTMPNYFRSMQLNNAAAPFSTYEALQDELASGAVKPAFRPWTVNNPTPLAKHPYQNIADAEAKRQYGFQAIEDSAKQVANMKGWEIGGKEYNDYIDSQLGLVQDAGTLVGNQMEKIRASKQFSEEQLKEIEQKLWMNALGLSSKGNELSAKDAAEVQYKYDKMAFDANAAAQANAAKRYELIQAEKAADPFASDEEAAARVDSALNYYSQGGNMFRQEAAPQAEPVQAEASATNEVPATSEAVNNDFVDTAVAGTRKAPKSEIVPAQRYVVKPVGASGERVAKDVTTGKLVPQDSPSQRSASKKALMDSYSIIAANPTASDVDNWIAGYEDYDARNLNVKDTSYGKAGLDDLTDKNGQTVAPGLVSMYNNMFALKQQFDARKKAYDNASDTVKKVMDASTLNQAGSDQASDQASKNISDLRDQIVAEEGGAQESMLMSQRNPQVSVNAPASVGYEFTSPAVEEMADNMLENSTVRSQIIGSIIPKLNSELLEYYRQTNLVPDEKTAWARAKQLLDGMEPEMQKAIHHNTWFGSEDPLNRAIVGAYLRQFIKNTLRK